MDYVEAVTQASTALKRGEASNWLLAQLTHDHTEGRAEGSPRVTLAQWCRDVREAAPGIKFSEGTGARYRDIWARYGHLPVDESATPEAREQRAVARFLREASPEKLAAAAATILANPVVETLAVSTGTDVGKAVSKVTKRRNAEMDDHARERTKDVPGIKEIDQAKAVSDLIHVVSRFASETQRLLGEMGQLPEPDADAFRTNLYLTDAYRRAEVAMEAIGALLRTGVPRQDIEDFFKRVVSRER
jgi:hypothetical protein